VGGGALGEELGPQGALAAPLDGTVRRFEEDGEVGVEHRGPVPGEMREPVELRVDLLALVEDVGDVATRLPDLLRELELDGDAALHVHGPAANQHVADPLGRQVRRVGERNGVDVAGEDHPLAATPLGAGDDGVAVTGDGEVRQRLQRGVDGRREGVLFPAHRRDVAERRRQGDDVEVEVQRRRPSRHTRRLSGCRGGEDAPKSGALLHHGWCGQPPLGSGT
jgi:hypothetical protein